MTTTHTLTFAELAKICKEIARDLHTIVEVKDYPEYKWGNIAFMTDKFGGVYTNLHFDHKTQVVTNWYGTKQAEVINDTAQLAKVVTKQMQHELKVRDLDSVYDYINSQY
jgi:hypothetical protein